MSSVAICTNSHRRRLAPGGGVEAREDRHDLPKRLVFCAGLLEVNAGQRVQADRPISIQNVEDDQAAFILERNRVPHRRRETATLVVTLAVEQEIAVRDTLLTDIRQRA